MNEVGSDITNLSNSSLVNVVNGDCNLGATFAAKDGIQNGKGNGITKPITEALRFATNVSIVPPYERFSAGNYLPKASDGALISQKR